MTDERRQTRRVHCFLPARTPKEEAILDELSSDSCRLMCTFEAAKGDVLSLKIYGQGGKEFTIRAVVTRVWTTPGGYRVACRFAADSRTVSDRLVHLVSASRPARA